MMKALITYGFTMSLFFTTVESFAAIVRPRPHSQEAEEAFKIRREGRQDVHLMMREPGFIAKISETRYVLFSNFTVLILQKDTLKEIKTFNITSLLQETPVPLITENLHIHQAEVSENFFAIAWKNNDPENPGFLVRSFSMAGGLVSNIWLPTAHLPEFSMNSDGQISLKN